MSKSTYGGYGDGSCLDDASTVINKHKEKLKYYIR